MARRKKRIRTRRIRSKTFKAKSNSLGDAQADWDRSNVLGPTLQAINSTGGLIGSGSKSLGEASFSSLAECEAFVRLNSDYGPEVASHAVDTGEVANAVSEAADAPEGPQGMDWSKLMGTVGSFAVTAAPWVSAGLSIASGILGAKAAREAGKEKGRYLRKKGARAMEMAERSSRNELRKQEFQEADDRAEISSNALFAGKESFQQGSLFESVLDNNKAAAKRLSQEILSEGREQQQEYDEAADAAERAGKKGGLGAIIGGVAGAAGSIGG